MNSNNRRCMLYIAILIICIAQLTTAKQVYGHRYTDYTSRSLERIVDYVNSIETTWKAKLNPRFENINEDSDLSSHLGVLFDVENSYKNDKTVPIMSNNYNFYLPENYDARDVYTSCPSLNFIRDQGSCGSCWAVAAASAITDRYCIALNMQVNISAMDLLSCCNEENNEECGYGCNGGYPIKAWKFWNTTGLVTGGSYNSSEGCKPYSIAPCSHHVEGYYPECGDIISTPACYKKCTVSDYATSYRKDKHHGKSYYAIEQSEVTIMNEIMSNGPVEAAFLVYADFLTYSTGVYYHSTGNYKGGHAVKLLGWGEENDVKFWLAANSWNTSWGDKGYFKILKGVNHCGIEQWVVAGEPYY